MTKKTSFYITTPIYYPSGQLHIGSAYTTIACDVQARYRRLMGYDVYYLTGLDEHGQKVQSSADKASLRPQDYVDHMAIGVQKLWGLLDISYDTFFRTTNPEHKKALQRIFEKLLDQDDIYLGEYSGWYSVLDEEFFTENQLSEVVRDEYGHVIGGRAPSGHKVEWVSEESYFFRMAKYSDRLLAFYDENPDFITPASWKNDVIKNFIQPGLEDLAISRMSPTWGIPVPRDPKHVIYVWMDALFSYLTVLGFENSLNNQVDRFWPADIHMVGKDIMRFHAIYWPIFLMALKKPIPKRLVVHGWYVMQDGKMSKSKGNVIYPEMLVKRYGLDSLRYYLMRSLPVNSDGMFTPEDYIGRINYELANDLGNLLNRTVAMINKYFDGEIPTYRSSITNFDWDLEHVVTKCMEEYHKQMEMVNYPRALAAIWEIIARTNRYVDETAPWTLIKNEKQRTQLASVMSHLAASLRVIAHLVQPFMMGTSRSIMKQIGLQLVTSLENLSLSGIPSGLRVAIKGEPIFPRLDMDKEITYIKSEMSLGGV